MFGTDRIAVRLLIFAFSLAGCIALCTYHGISSKRRIILLTDQMFQDGRLTGRFWEVERCEKRLVTLEKYGYSVSVASNNLVECRPGDKISFIARIKAAGNESRQWSLEKIHIHGTSLFKFLFSAIGVLFVLVLCRKHLSIARNSWGLTFKEQSNSCRTD